jgi:2-polyprenyl-6-methoxyphenol hydroxylase-like FAD-dependent oxidoreductase
MTGNFDAAVIGAGQARPALAVKLAVTGQRVAIVERRHLGGSCVNFGCTPTKAMVASARGAWMARRAAELGIRIDGEVRVDMGAVSERAARIVEQSRNGCGEQVLAVPTRGLERIVLERASQSLGCSALQQLATRDTYPLDALVQRRGIEVAPVDLHIG